MIRFNLILLLALGPCVCHAEAIENFYYIGKQVFAPDGKPMMLMEGTFKSITPQTFRLLSRALPAKAEPPTTSKPTR